MLSITMSVTYHVLSPLVSSQILFHFPYHFPRLFSLTNFFSLSVCSIFCLTFPSKTGSEEASENMRSISSSSREMENLSLQNPRNLLERFISSDTRGSTTSEKTEDVELNLGLSLGGRFGVDKEANKLKRSSSIAGSIPILREDDEVNTSQSVPYPTTLMRTSSLPTESEEEWRKRKNLQTLRRMHAMRRRSEKQRSSKEKMEEINKAIQGARNFGEARSSSGALSLQVQGDRGATGSSGTKTSETGRTPGLVGETVGNKRKERGNTMEDMPCVFTKAEGPNGKRTDGILYEFGKGKEVRIMCVCHGEFLTPAEFVKHAGGGDVDNPLRHIVINPSSASLL